MEKSSSITALSAAVAQVKADMEEMQAKMKILEKENETLKARNKYLEAAVQKQDSEGPKSSQGRPGPSGRYFRYNSSSVKESLIEGTDATLVPSTPSTSKQALLPHPCQGQQIGLSANPPASFPISRGNYASTPYDERPVVGTPVRARAKEDAGGTGGRQQGPKKTTLFRPYNIKKK